MASVVLLRGVNVGGHRTFRPALLTRELQHLDVVNIGAAGTFVVRRPIGPRRLRAEFARRLPFETEIMIVAGREIDRLMMHSAFANQAAEPGIVRFVSVLARAPRSTLPTPLVLPPDGEWLVKVVAVDGKLVLGMYRRHMKVIGYLGKLDRMFGCAATTRNWNTFVTLAEALHGKPTRPARSRLKPA